MSDQAPRVLVVIPTYNHGSTVAGVVDGARAQGLDVLVVDDGSNPATSNIDAINRVSLIRHSINQGKGVALRSGFQWARERQFTHVITMDADGQHSPSSLPDFMSAIAANPDAIIVGRRDFANGGDVPFSSRFGRAFSDFWVRLETGVIARDTQSGFRAYPLRDLPDNACARSRYDFEVEIIVRASWAGIKTRDIPIVVSYPPRDRRISHFHPWRDNARLTRLHTRLCATRLLRATLPRRASTERGGAILLALFARFGGPAFCYFLAPLVLVFYFVTRPTARRGVIALHRVLGRRGFLSVTLHAFLNYTYFAACLIDRMALASGRSSVIARHDGRGPIPDFSRPVIIVGAHQGDWLLAGIGLARSGIGPRRLSIVIDLARTPDFMRRFQSALGANATAPRFIDAGRPGMSVVLDVRRALDEGDTVCFLGDRGQDRSRRGAVPFLGNPAEFPMGPFDIALALKVPVWAFFSRKSAYRPSAPHIVSVSSLFDGNNQVNSTFLLERFVAALESEVRATPHQWFNFFDFWAPIR